MSHDTASSTGDLQNRLRINHSISITHRCWRSSTSICLSVTIDTGSGNMRRLQPNQLVKQSPHQQHQLGSRKCHQPLNWLKIPVPPEKTFIMSWVLMENLPKQKRSSTISRTSACTMGAPSTNMTHSVGSRISPPPPCHWACNIHSYM